MLAMFVTLAPLIAMALLLQAVVPQTGNPLVEQLVRASASLVMPVGTIALVWVFMKYLDRRPLREAGLFWDRRTLPTFLLGVALMVVLQVGSIGAASALGFSYAPEQVETNALLWAIGILASSLVHASFCEELLFRGYLMQTLPQRSPWVVAAISAVAFGVLHMVSQGQEGLGERALYAVGPTGWAFLAAALVVVFRNLAPAVGVHFGAYLASDAASLLGWGEGPVAWVITGVVSAAAGAAILAWHGRRQPEMPSPLFAKA